MKWMNKVKLLSGVADNSEESDLFVFGDSEAKNNTTRKHWGRKAVCFHFKKGSGLKLEGSTMLNFKSTILINGELKRRGALFILIK